MVRSAGNVQSLVFLSLVLFGGCGVEQAEFQIEYTSSRNAGAVIQPSMPMAVTVGVAVRARDLSVPVDLTHQDLT